MLIHPSISLIERQGLPYKNSKLIWDFGGNSSAVFLVNNNNGVTCSEHWITECSDSFSFDMHGNLSSVRLAVPTKNKNIDIHITNTIFGELILHGKIYVVEQMNVRYFDPKNKKLFCVNNNLVRNAKVSLVKLHNDLSIILSDGKYSGWIFTNPISYITMNKDEECIDIINVPDDNEYRIMSRFFHVMSDNMLEKLDDSMSCLVYKLDNEISRDAQNIKSEYRKNIILSSVKYLVDSYCDWD